ncbi:triosephosphate isomerase [Sulfobacillus thermosulfidooxidans DSM 9293]|uniref:Triosephosphate isomerase n=1 Tax=Sulfobacillus thermosulfidooxidans (strain DSM 9293 / VKM B-1269 / AT-1) TaxID=929705 RepID=A0A1W1W8T5_SULTA|nr:triose-phosphate isomerase [Sulfobacillus thermosulfidooxidans]SMC02696.1 triosephosphate isomerase [Sulfobacillus thermosulfidooxidans DSM 9293]
MNYTRETFLIANWKMHKTVEEGRAFARELVRRLENVSPKHQLIICPTALSLWAVGQELATSPVMLGAQNLDLGREGALTGALSGYLIREAGARWVIVGHSERRNLFGETDALIGQKVAQAFEAHLRPILCVGESLDDYRSGQTFAVITRQIEAIFPYTNSEVLKSLVVAYEPVWAIGSGEVPEPKQANEVAGLIRQILSKQISDDANTVPVLYGGSVSSNNIHQFLEQAHIDGSLVGGASLQVDEFLKMADIGH